MPADPPRDPSGSAVQPRRPSSGESSAEALRITPAPRAGDRSTLGPAGAQSGTAPRGPSLVGTELDDLEILAELGRGGMGVVYKGRQKSLDRTVAVKVLRSEHLENPGIVQRFLTEARAAAGLDHPCIVKVYHIGRADVGHYFVMEYIDGQLLEAFIKKGPLPVSGSAALILRVAEAVHYAHGKGIIHRDLKPSNIMINRFRQPVILDFGIVKFVHQVSSLTQEGVVIGTPAFLPPEQAGEEGKQVGPYSDVYSLGAILYTMLSGRFPYQGKTALDTLLKVMGAETPPPLRKLRAEVPEELERICMKCLEKNPAVRYQTAQALAEDLRRFRAGEKAPAPAVSASMKLPPVFLVDDQTGAKLRLTGPTTAVGRAPENDVVLKGGEVSKNHCRILWQDGRAIIEDLDSSNGTWVNSHMIERCRLEDGDKLEIGGHFFTVRIAKPKAP